MCAVKSSPNGSNSKTGDDSGNSDLGKRMVLGGCDLEGKRFWSGRLIKTLEADGEWLALGWSGSDQ
jgi:hypothetical protein